MPRHAIRYLAAGFLLALGLGARAQTFTDYTKVVPITIQNNDSVATPTPTSAEVTFPIDTTNMRTDRLDVRVGYNNGTSVQEIASQVFRTTPNPASPWFTENLNAGSTGYATLPAGSEVTPGTAQGDDSGISLTLPFNFPFAGGSSNQVFMSTDGYVSPGPGTPTSQYGRGGTTGGSVGIWPYASDYTTTANGGPAGSALYFYADATQAVFRWEVAESGKSTIIAKFGLILYPNGNIRFVYSNLVTPPTAGVGGQGSYGEVAYGVQAGYYGAGFIHYPTDSYPTSADFSNHPDILYTPLPVVIPTEQVRAVFRLQASIPAGGTSTGQYSVYYGAVSPQIPALRDVKQVFDTYYDFSAAALGTATDWDVQGANNVKVESYQGRKVGVLRGGFNHAQASLKAGVIPNFLNVETLAHIAADGGGEREMAPMVRVVSDPGDAYFQGGYGYAVDSFGSGSHIVSYINGNADNGPADMGGVPHAITQDVFENVLFRVDGVPGVLQGKNWSDGAEEPSGWMVQVVRGDALPSHAAGLDPQYNSPGTIGMANYFQPFALDYMALRELRKLGVSTGAVQTVTPAGPFIQGTVTTAGSPLSTATITITSGATSATYSVSALGAYKISVPAGSYTVTATAPCYEPQTQTVSPSASGQTNFSLIFGCGTVSGVLRDAVFGQLQGGSTVTLIDSAGMYVTSTIAAADGSYTLTYPAGGTYSIGAMTTTGYGGRVTLTLPSAGTVKQDMSLPLMANGDCEIPNASNTNALGWTTSFDAPGAYLYTQAQNHTPGGHWSMAIKDPSTPDASNHLSGLNEPPVAGFFLPAHGDVFDVTVSVWVYFTKVGQNVSIRLRENFGLSGGINRVFAKCGSPPDPNNLNTGGLDGSGNVPLNTWYNIKVTAPAGSALAGGGTLGLNLYAMNSNFTTAYLSPAFNGGADGTIYFDDWSVTQTVKAQALGRVVDEAGIPVSDAFVGVLTDQGGGGPVTFTSPLRTNADGTFKLYALAPGDITVAAWKLPPSAAGVLPDYGYTGQQTLSASSNPPQGPDLVLKRANNVADGSTGTAVDTASTNRAVSMNLAVDNNVNTRSNTTGGPPAEMNITYDLGSVKSVNQIEILWEAACSNDYDLIINDGTTDTTVFSSQTAAGFGILPGVINYSSAAEGPTQIFTFPTAQNVKTITIHTFAFNGGTTNFSIIELRALSLAGALPLARVDAVRAVQIAGGLTTASAADKTRLDVDGNGKIEAVDAVKILRTLSGL